MDAGASILTFVVVGLQSIRFIHDVVSTIKDWPGDTAKLATDVKSLEVVLQRIAEAGTAIPDASRVLMQRCAGDLGRYAERLRRFVPSDAEKRSGKLWRRLRAIVDERDLRRMRELIREYVHRLTLELEVMHRDDLCETSRSLQDSIAVIARGQQDFQEKNTNQLDSQASKINNLEDGIVDINAHLTARCQSLQGAVESMATVSGSQQEYMIAMLKHLSEQITDLQQARFPVCGLASQEGPVESNCCPTGQDTVSQAIDRLCGLLNEKPCTVASEKAQSIIEDVERLLDLVNHQLSESNVPEGGMQPKGTITKKDIKYIKALLNSTPRLQLQNAGNKMRPPRDTRLTSKRRREVFELDPGMLTITTNKRYRVSQDGEVAELDESMVNLSFITKWPTRSAVLSATLSQYLAPTENVLSIPNLIINPVLPIGSPVFKVVERGSVKELEQMLREGRASLRDHDEYGAPLLHYAAAGRAVEMCEYLVKSNSDIDALANTKGLEAHNSYETVQTALHYPMGTFNGEASRSIINLLMNAGADPTIQAVENDHVVASAVQEAFSAGNPELMRTVFDLGQYHISVHTPDDDGLLPIHWLVKFQCTCDGLEFLLQRGTDINARDSQGRTCLHIVISTLKGEFGEQPDFSKVEAVQLLVDNGADIHALDNNGHSPTDYAYRSRDRAHDSFISDAWDSVLARCDCDISGFRKGYPRRPGFTNHYTRKDFNRLWEGFESSCPYYDSWYDTHTYDASEETSSIACDDDEPDPELARQDESESNIVSTHLGFVAVERRGGEFEVADSYEITELHGADYNRAEEMSEGVQNPQEVQQGRQRVTAYGDAQSDGQVEKGADTFMLHDPLPPGLLDEGLWDDEARSTTTEALPPMRFLGFEWVSAASDLENPWNPRTTEPSPFPPPELNFHDSRKVSGAT